MKNAEDYVKRLIARMEDMKRKLPSNGGFLGLEGLYISDGIKKLRWWLDQREAGNEDDAELLEILFFAGMVSGRQFYQSEHNSILKWGTSLRHRGIARTVEREYASGKHRNITAARRAVAERHDVSLRTVYNAEKRATKKR